MKKDSKKLDKSEINLLNLGGHLYRQIKDTSTNRPIEMSDECILELAKRFYKFCLDDSDSEPVSEDDTRLYKFVKTTLCGRRNRLIAKFILKGDFKDLINAEIICSSFEFKNQGACMSLSCFRRLKDEVTDDCRLPFIVSDLICRAESLVEVISLESCKYQAGRLLLNDIIHAFDTVPIALRAGFLHYGDYELATENDALFKRTLNKLVHYYKSFGFEDINWLCGFEESVAMFSSNNSGVKIERRSHPDNLQAFR